MKWYRYVGYFFAGAFFANTIPHLVQGISGLQFRTPFGDPSSALLNGIWGLINLALGVTLLIASGGLELKFNRKLLVIAVGFAVMTLLLANTFSQQAG
ncbi:MAG TPA: hypothetical protein VJ565_00115 [Dehalococcoidia bacterium]|nr:hypothetical protein [Dehalococcoidia bacterium]